MLEIALLPYTLYLTYLDGVTTQRISVIAKKWEELDLKA
jgi:hypothetical protein